MLPLHFWSFAIKVLYAFLMSCINITYPADLISAPTDSQMKDANKSVTVYRGINTRLYFVE